jgi:S1-C subfamily serine protease
VAAELHVLSGEQAGLVLPLAGAECTLGRHPACALRFGSQAEGGVSARHARLVADGAGWLLRDLGSTNGTWLNGRRVGGDTLLRDGDRIALGEGGPVIEFRRAGAGAALPVAPPPRPRAARRRWAAGAALAAALVVGGAVGVYATRPRPPAASANAPAAAARTRTAELAPPDAFRAAPAQPPRAASTPPSPAPLPRARPSAARPAPAPSTSVPVAARVEAGGAAPLRPVPPQRVAVDARNRRAVVRIYVEGEDGQVSTGTGFAVRADGTLVTNRHVLGRRPARIAVQFASSSQVWRARVVAVSGEWDVALLKVDDIVGAVPTVRGLNLRADTLAEGVPVALVGFPRGGEPVEGAPIRAAVSHGAFARVRAGRVEVFARSSVGASGSPLFDARGEVVGVLFGGTPGAARPVLYAVPASALAAFLADR